MYDKIIKSFYDFYLSIIDKLPDIMVSTIVLIVFIVIGKLSYRIFRKKIQERWKDSIISSFFSEFLKWSFYITGITFALFNLGLGSFTSSILAGAGVTAVIIGFAFKDIAENFLAGILLAVNRPFKVGDIIEVSGIKGPVKGLDLRTTHIKTNDGRDIYIPNSLVIKSVFTNFTRDGFLRLDFTIGLDTPSDIERARELIIEHLIKNKEILKEPAPNVIIELLGSDSITIKVMFWINILKSHVKEQPKLGEPIKSKVMREIKDLLIENKFNMPGSIQKHKMYSENDAIRVKIIGKNAD